MTTIVNNPAPVQETDGGSSGLLIGLIVVIGCILVFAYFGIPALKNLGPVQLNVPAPQIVMPEKIDVNVTQTK